MPVAPRPQPGLEHLIKFEEDPRRLIPIEYQKQFTIWEAYDLIDKFAYYDKDHSGCIDAEELKVRLDPCRKRVNPVPFHMNKNM